MSMSNVSINVLKELRRQVEVSNKVCKHDIISLEEFVGEPIVSSKVNIDKLTVVPSSIGAAEVLEALNEGVDKYNKLAQGPSLIEIRETITLLLNETLPRLVTLACACGNKSISNKSLVEKLLKAATSEKIIYRYDDNKELIDVSNLPLDVVYDKYKDYFNDVYGLLHKTTIGYELPVVEETYVNSVSKHYNTLLNYVESEDLHGCVMKTPKNISFKDLATVASSRVKLLDKLKQVSKRLQTIINPNSTLEATPEVLGYVEIYKSLTNEDYISSNSFGGSLLTSVLTKKSVADAIE